MSEPVKAILAAPLAGVVLPSAAEQWPMARRSAFVACWALVTWAARPTSTWEAACAAVEGLGERPTFDTAIEAAAMWCGVRLDAEESTSRDAAATLDAEPWARALVAILVREIGPDVEGVEDLKEVEVAAWEALQDLAPAPIASLEQWPIEVRAPPLGSPSRRVPFPPSPPASFLSLRARPEYLPSREAAVAWLATLREASARSAAWVCLACVRACSGLRAVAIREAFEVARRDFLPDAPSALLSSNPKAAEDLDAALASSLAALIPRVRDTDAAGALADALRRTGAYGARDAERVLARPPPVEAWCNPRRVVARLALALWCDLVAPRLSKQVVIEKRAIVPIADLLSPIHRDIEPSGQITFDFRRPGETDLRVRAIPEDVAQKLVDQGIRLFASVPAQKLFRWEVFAGHSQAFALKGEAAATLHIDGGFQALTYDVLRLSASADERTVRAVVEAQHVIEVRAPDGTYGPIATRYLRPPAPGGRRSRLTIVLGPALVPFDAGTLSLEARSLARLVPMLPDMPPFASDRSTWAAQGVLQIRVLLHFREHATELSRSGSVPLSARQRDWLAEKSGLAPHARAAVWERWQRDGTGQRDPGPAFLTMLEGGERATLAPAHAATLRWLADTGREMLGRKAAHGGLRSSSVGSARRERR